MRKMNLRNAKNLEKIDVFISEDEGRVKLLNNILT